MTNANLENQLSQLRIDKERKLPVRRKSRWGWVVLLLVAAGAVYAAYHQMNAAVAVQTARVEKETIVAGQGPALVTASGYVVPRHNVEVSSKIIGRIVEMNIKRGDHVSAGDVLIRIENEEYKARVLSSESQVATLRARLAELRAGSRPQEIEAANSAVASAEATLKSAELDLLRLGALVKQGAVSQQDLDRARVARCGRGGSGFAPEQREAREDRYAQRATRRRGSAVAPSGSESGIGKDGIGLYGNSCAYQRDDSGEASRRGRTGDEHQLRGDAGSQELGGHDGRSE